MDLCVLIADPHDDRRRKMEKQIKDFSAKQNIHKLNIFECSKETALETLSAQQCLQMQMAFLSLDFENANEAGAHIYRNNPACRLIYHTTGDRNLVPFLPTRPVWYWDANDNHDLDNILEMQMNAMKEDPYMFYYSDRLRSLAVSCASILYAYSLKRAVYLHTETKEEGPLPKSLDEIGKMLPQDEFVRVHQSFLVRRDAVYQLNRKTHVLILKDGTEIPVSRALYENASQIFTQNVDFNVQNDEMKDKTDTAVLALGQEVTET